MNEQDLKMYTQCLFAFTIGYIVMGAIFTFLILNNIVEAETFAYYGAYLIRILNLDILRDLF